MKDSLDGERDPVDGGLVVLKYSELGILEIGEAAHESAITKDLYTSIIFSVRTLTHPIPQLLELCRPTASAIY
jgi:hypothetical protein